MRPCGKHLSACIDTGAVVSSESCDGIARGNLNITTRSAAAAQAELCSRVRRRRRCGRRRRGRMQSLAGSHT